MTVEELKKQIAELVDKIDDEALLRRIYLFTVVIAGAIQKNFFQKMFRNLLKHTVPCQ